MNKGEVCYLTKDDILSIHQSQLEEFGGDEGAIPPDLIDSIVASAATNPEDPETGIEAIADWFAERVKLL